MFTHFNLNERLQKALTKSSFSQPTHVQEKSIPYAIQGKDLFVTAPTGTGKTAAFLLPLLHNLLTKGKPGVGLQALIISPTRELATQTYKTLEDFSSYTFFRSCLVTGGEDIKQQAAALRKNPDIVVGTPGRLIEQYNAKQFTLESLQILVLDETDRMLDMGFGDDVKFLLNESPTNKQTLLFSATLGEENLQSLAKSLLNKPVEIHLNTENKPNPLIKQQAILADDAPHKTRLIHWLLAHEAYKQVIIFTNTRAQADLLSNMLTVSSTKHAVLHSEKSADERKQILARLKQQHVNILIATDVAARGLDIKQVDFVINFDLPNTTDEYTHRIGRTGRMNNEGTAISLVSIKDQKKLAKIEKDLNQPLIKRMIDSLKGKCQTPSNPKNVTTHLTTKTMPTTTKKAKKSTRTKKASTLVSADGLAPLKRKKD